MIFSKENDSFIEKIALKNDLDMDTIISAYLICGNDFRILLHVFAGKTIKFPSSRKLIAPSLSVLSFVEDDDLKYHDYEKDDIVTIADADYKVVSSEKKILNHWYLPVIKLNDDEDIK